MTASTLSFGVTDLALEKAQDVDRRVLHTSKSSSFANFMSNAFAGLVARFVRKQARELANQAVWFQGAKAALGNEREEGKLHASDELIEALEKVEAHIIRGREGMLDILKKQELSKGNLVFINAVRAYVMASADFYEAVSSFRWAAMEADADADIAHGNVRAFQSSDELFANLNG